MRQKARPLELKVERILNKNSSTFSEEDACLAPRAGLKKSATSAPKSKIAGRKRRKNSQREFVAIF
ncbi:hypothetical protein CYJ29_05430 [Aerococcus loyolae]|uniref:Uncharacterized protein n=1 Tax=Aerococcus urinae TaxID=1376 RepID=A0A2I1L6U7_9LACT|nr:hypothetical protein HMPREF2784_07070 [Aerococcus loyolae]PKY85684.1 hypothetical protein CYJ30_04940 [Aerococcus loyolae]PKZ03599.1 hypothetical protein CYJ29_05430 [Aerococcus loyolae]RAV81386.1 hypothetical protein DBT54_00500 [Aerococcus loyolae]